MALSIGELVGYLTFDDSGVNEGARAAEQRIAKMGATAENTLDGSAGRIGESGRRAGEGYGTGLSTGAGAGADRAGNEVESRTAGWKGKVAAAAGSVGGAAGAGFSLAAAGAVELEAVQTKLTAQLGLTAEESKRIGGVAGDLYANAYGENLGEVGDAVAAVMQHVEGMSTATDAELQSVTGQMMSLAQTLQVDVGGASAAVGQMLKTGLAANAQEAMDILVAGAQAGANAHGDLADTIAGSAGTLAQFGLDGKTSIGLINQTLAAGAPSADFFIGALEELAGNAGDSVEVFDSLGLSGTQMAQDLNAGGTRARDALGTLMGALRGMQDPAARSTALVGLFGEEATAMQAALLAVDPAAAVTALGDVAGKSMEADAALSSLSTAQIDKMTRGFEMWAASMVTTEGPLGTVTAAAMAFGPTALGMAGSLSMIVVAIGPLIGRLGALALSAATTAGRFALSMLGMAANAALAVGRILISLALWVAQILAQGAIAVASMVATAARYVAAWVLMGVQAMARAVMMAAAWLVAMGPIGWVIAAVVGLVALIIANWDTVVAWTQQAWSAVTAAIGAAWEWIKSAVATAIDFLVGLFLNFTGPGLIIKHWDTIKAATAAAFDAVVAFIRSAIDQALAVLGWLGRLPGLFGDWFAGAYNAVRDWLGRALGVVAALPGQILSAVGNLGSLLFNAGRDVVIGLWNGIVGMGHWLYSKIMGWIRSVVPGPILSFLGIASPSKFMKNEVGRWIPEGLADGIIGNAKVAGDAARELAAGVAAEAQAQVMSGPMLSDIGRAAQEILGQMNRGGQVFEDLSFRGNSDNVRAYNNQLFDRADAAGVQPHEMKAWLERFVTAQTRQGGRTVNVEINNPQAERSSDSIGRAGSTLAAVGPWGDE